MTSAANALIAHSAEAKRTWPKGFNYFPISCQTIGIKIFYKYLEYNYNHHIPLESPAIFVGAPHANLYGDGLLITMCLPKLASTVVAKVSFAHKVAGMFLRACGCLPVIRPFDFAKPGAGSVHFEDNDESIIHGINTQFKTQVPAGKSSILIKGGETYQIVEILSDTQLRVRKPPAVAATAASIDPPSSHHHGKHVKHHHHHHHKKVPAMTKEDPAEYKIIPPTDNYKNFRAILDHLRIGGWATFMLEGVSHDRSDLLPFKPGAATLALSALADSEDPITINIIPCGFNYENSHLFRSSAFVNFGKPFTASSDLVEEYKAGGERKAKAVAALHEQISNAVNQVIIRASDFETLNAIKLAGRLVCDDPQNTVSLFISSKQFQDVYDQHGAEAEIEKLMLDVKQYDRGLRRLGISDEQLTNTTLNPLLAYPWLLFNFFAAALLWLFVLPGAILHLPVILVAQYAAYVQRKHHIRYTHHRWTGTDVEATWKVFPSIFTIPMIYLCWTGVLYTILNHPTFKQQPRINHLQAQQEDIYAFLWMILTLAGVCVVALPLIGLSCIQLFDAATWCSSERTLAMRVIVNPRTMQRLKQTREGLARHVLRVLKEKRQ